MLVAVLALRRADLSRRRPFFAIAGTVACSARAGPQADPDSATSAAASGCCRASGGCGCRSTCPTSRTATRGRCRPATGSCSSTPACTTAARWATSSGRSSRPATRSRDVKLIVITHAHIDHCGQAPPIAERAGCEVWMHPALEAARRAPAGPRPHDRGRAAERRARGAAAALGGAPPRPRAPARRASSTRDRDLVPGVDDRDRRRHLAGDRDARPRAVARLPAPARAAPADLRRPPARPRLAVLRRRLHAGPGRRVPALARRHRRRSTPGSRFAGHARPFTDIPGHIQANRDLVARNLAAVAGGAGGRREDRLRGRARGLRRAVHRGDGELADDDDDRLADASGGARARSATRPATTGRALGGSLS